MTQRRPIRAGSMAPTFLTLEASIAAAHRRLFAAREAAALLGKDGLEEDLFQLMVECERLQTDLLRGKGRRTQTHSDAL